MDKEIKERIAAINSGIIPEGYKKTKVGIVPVEWETKTLGQVLHRVSNAVNVENDIQYQQIGIRSHGKGLFYKEKVSGAELGNKSVFWIEPDCFILNIVFAWEQAIGKTTKNEIGMIASHRFPMYKPQGIDIDYLVFYFLTQRGNTLLELASPGGAGRNKTLGQENFLNSKVILPPLHEQQKIAEILSTQDKLIELQEKKIEQLKELKKAYLQKMFPKKGSKYPEFRFKGFTDPWEQREFGSLLVERREKTKTEDEDILLSCAIEGIFLNSELFSHFRGSSNIGYLKIKKNDLILSAQNLHLGNCNVNLRFENGIISPAYKVYELIECNPLFIQAWVKQDSTKDFFLRATTEGASACRKNVVWEELYKQEVAIPSFDEQKAIGQYFHNLDTLITLHQRKSEQEKQKKKALMQLLLTGIVRTK